MTNSNDELQLSNNPEKLMNVSFGEISLNEVELIDDNEITITIDSGEDGDDSESIIDSYIHSLDEGKDTSLTDITIEQLSAEGNKANILAAGFQISISSGDKFDSDVMVKERLDAELEEHQNTSLKMDDGNFMDDPTAVQPSFSQSELEGLAKILANVEGNMKIRKFKSEVNRLNQKLKDNIAETSAIGRKNNILESHVIKLSVYLDELKSVLADLEGLDAGRDTSATLQLKMRQGISAMHVKDKLNKVYAELGESEKIYKELKERKKFLEEEFDSLLKEKTKLQKQIESVMGNLDVQSALTEVVERYAKVVAVEFGTEHFSKDFKEAPVFLKCQCGCISKFSYDEMPRYVGLRVTQYNEYKSKIQSYSREQMNNLVMSGLTDEENSKLKCDNCKKDLMFSPSILQDFVKSSFGLEVLAIEKHSKSVAVANTPEDYLDSGVYYVLSGKHFPSEYIRDLGYVKYFESKTSSISINPLVDIQEDIPLTEKEERIARMFNPDVPEEMFNASVKTIHNLINSINVFLNTVQKEHLKINSNATSKAALERNKINRKMSKFIASQRWLMISYCVNKQMPISGFKERLDTAYKSVANIQKFQNELFDFFVEHVVNSVVEGRDIFYVDSDQSTKLLEVKKYKLPHQIFFNRYKPLICNYFKIRSKKINSLAELKTFQSVLSGVAGINKIESKEKAIEKSEEIVCGILKDIDELIENGLSKDFNLRGKLIEQHGKIAERTIKYLVDNDKGKYDDGNFYAWVAYEAKNSLLTPKELPTNEPLYNKFYEGK